MARSRKRRGRNRGAMLICTALLAALALAFGLRALLAQRPTPAAPAPQATAVPAAVSASVSPEATASATEANAPSPTAPASADGLLPVYRTVENGENMIAITVDDCYRTVLVARILDAVEASGARVTFFPVGRALKNNPDVWKRAHEMGCEIESHGYTHTDMLDQTEEEIRKELSSLNGLLDSILGGHYRMHFLRTPGGDARNDPRVHAIMRDMGYLGMAHWAFSGTANKSRPTFEQLQSGQILLFHATEKDVKKLEWFLPAAMEAGWRVVTLNELTGYPANEFTPGETGA